MADSSGNWVYLNSSTTPQEGEWYHIVLTHAADNTNNLYINGVLENSNTREISFSTSNPLHIGKFYVNSTSLGFNGVIDEVKLWGKTLTQEEVNTMYTLTRSTCTGSCYTDSVVEYKMENFPWNGTAEEVKDTGGSTEENGVAVSHGTGVIPGQTNISGGKVCRSGVFTRADATNGGYLDFGDAAALDPGNNHWTVSAWFNWDGSSTSENILYNKETLYEIRINSGYLHYAWRPHWSWDGGTSFSVTANTWYHVTTVYDGHQQRLYKNGQLVYARAQTGTMGSNSSHMLIGARGSTNPRSFWGGMIDEVRMYDRALAENEVAAVYASGASCPDDYPIITSTSLTDGVIGSAYSATPTGSGGDLPYGWDMLSSTVSGLSISDHSTGEITGTIGSCAGNYNVEVRLTDNNNVTDTKLLPLTVNNGTLISSPATVSLTCEDDQSIVCQQDFTVSGPRIGNLTGWAITWQSVDPGGFEVSSTGSASARVNQTGNSTVGTGYRFRLTASDASCPANILTTAWSTVDIQ
jgi:hypothetical protein